MKTRFSSKSTRARTGARRSRSPRARAMRSLRLSNASSKPPNRTPKPRESRITAGSIPLLLGVAETVLKPVQRFLGSRRHDAEPLAKLVGSTGIDQELDIRVLAEDLDGGSYDPDVFPGLVHRIQYPKASCLMFRSGKIVCTGASSIGDFEHAVALTFDTLREVGLEAPANPDLTMQNIVASGDEGV